MPTMAKASMGCTLLNTKATPTTLSAFISAMSLAFGIESAKGPMSGAKNTYDRVKENLSKGAHQPG